MQCPNCGHTEECPHCAIPVTYHRATSQLRCHLCDHQRAVPVRCPKCEFENYKYGGAGTQRIEDAVAESLGHVRWQRVDSDSIRGKHTLERILGAFGRGEIDVLIGTQMIAKGLDFPNVTCVGVVQCDTSINLPDFRAAERVFQQLIQVAGRAGRGKVRGEVFIQTYMPFHPVFSFARHHDVDGFLQQELEFRKAHGYPPFSRTALVTFRSKSENKASYCMDQAVRKLREEAPPRVAIPDPAPAPIPRIKDEFRFHLFLRTPAMSKLTPLLRKHVLEPAWPDDVRVTADVDPLHLL
jgi:primosomal protein N' (replication factor Y)